MRGTGRRLVISVAIAAVGLGAVAASAIVADDLQRDAAFTIDRFDRQVTVASDGVLDVVETIDVSFHEPRRGIFRDLEPDGPAGPVTHRVETVDRGPGGQPWVWVEEHTDAGAPRIRVGEADVVLDPGPQRYRLTSTIEGLLYRPAARPDRVELRLDVPGDAWPTDVAVARLRVDLPAVPLDVRCVVGRTGSVRACPPTQVEGPRVRQELPALAPFETGTVAIDLPAATFPVPVPPTVDVPELGEGSPFPGSELPPAPAALLLTALIASPALLLELRRVQVVYRDQVTDPALHDRPVPTALVEPPDGKAPAELTGVLRPQATRDAFLATLIDLDVRGIVASSSPERRSRVTFTPTGAPAPRAWERVLMTQLFPADRPITFHGSYEPETARRYRDGAQVVERRVAGEMEPGGIYVHERGPGLRGTRFAAKVVGVLLLGAAIGVTGVILWRVPASTLVLIWAVLGVSWVAFSRLWRPERRSLTSEGRDIVARATAFRTYLEQVHADRFDHAATREDLGPSHPALELLPYAVALGLGTSWYERFEPLIAEAARRGDGSEPWYAHQRTFTSVTLLQSRVTHDPASASSDGGSSFSSSSGSSFSSGGAGSGGGGGGGGSW